MTKNCTAAQEALQALWIAGGATFWRLSETLSVAEWPKTPGAVGAVFLKDDAMRGATET